MDGLLQVLAAAELLVHAGQGDDAVAVGLEAALASEVLEEPRGGGRISGELRDPGLGQAGQLVDVLVLAPVLRGQPLARLPRLVGPPGEEEAEDLLQLQVGGGLAPELELADGQELARPALGVPGELEQGAQPRQRGAALRAFGVELGPAGHGGGEGAPHVLDLREQVQRRAVLGGLVEDAGHHGFRVVQLADLRQDLGVLQFLDCRGHSPTL